ncbi:olfactory receptor 8J2-like [Sarcophilus harrisii]
MISTNLSHVTTFILIGVSERQELQLPLFFIFLAIYGVTVTGNVGIITLTSIDSRLQTPMYFFLRHLAIINLGNSTVIAPQMLVNFLVEEKTISYYGCATQLGGFLVFIVAEIFMLAAMAYDRYVAICNPLLYMVVVSRKVCILLVILTYIYSLTTAVTVTSCVFSMSYCSSNVINHFYCDNVPLLALSCSDTYIPETAVFTFSGTNLFFSMIIVIVSYFFIILAILRIRSAEGRKKAFSTCTSHMTAVTVFYGTLLFMYLQPRSNHSLDTDKMASVFYTLVIPMLNPMIYSLRNKDVKEALKRMLTNPCQTTKEMEGRNETATNKVIEFIIMGVTDLPELQIPLFLVFLFIYSVTVVANLGMVILTKIDSHLQTPMYFFLRHLSLIDLGYSTAIGPKMLVSFVVDKNIISFTGCAIQLFVFVTLIISELFVLSAMAYDRYVAICKPLLYTVIMSDRVCWILVAIPYLYSTCVSLLIAIKIFNSSFCRSNVIRHFYCDNLPLLSMICSNTSDIELIILSLSAFNLFSSLLVVLVSYVFILVAILRMNSAEGRRKAFSTCGSHFTVLVVFYGTLIFMYLQPKSSHSFDTDKMASVFYTLVIPMLNPLIYSLRNTEVKAALKRALRK